MTASPLPGHDAIGQLTRAVEVTSLSNPELTQTSPGFTIAAR